MRRILLFLVAIFSVGFMLSQPARAATAVPPITASDIVLGKSDAPITIIEYASLTCPHCAEFEQATWPELRRDWIDTGKARYVFRDFPLDGLALRAAILARCAPANRFYPFIETLYANQTMWAMAEDPMAALQRIGLMGGVPAAKFQACEADASLQQTVVASRQAGENAGVDATPTFFINGTKVTGALPYSDFQKALGEAAKGS
jgi:protein-disulfide isomerase